MDRAKFEYKRKVLSRLVKNFYDFQEIRIGHRLRDAAAERNEIELEKKDEEVFELINEGVTEVEKTIEKQIKKAVREFPIYNQFLKNVTGCGHMMSAVLISKFNPYDSPAPEGYNLKDHATAYERDGVVYRVRTCSQFWAYAGLHCIEIEKDGVKKFVAAKPVKGEKLSYDPWLKSKMLGVLGPCFLKANSPYRAFYDGRKEYKKSINWGECDAHRHKDALRHMAKCFLLDLYCQYRALLNLPIRQPYATEKLGLTPAQAWHVTEHPGFAKKKEEVKETA